MLDNTLFFSDAQAITASAASSNVIQLNGGDLHHGLYLVLKVVGADFATCTSITPSLQTSDESTFSSPTTAMTLPTYAVASLTNGTVLAKVCLPVGMKKFARLYYTVTGSNATAGKMEAFLTDNPGIGIGNGL